MNKRYTNSGLNSLFAISNSHDEFYRNTKNYKNLIHIHWNRLAENVSMVINSQPATLLPNQITTNTYNQNIQFNSKENFPLTFSFNREFYSIVDHDKEVSCNGIIFFGSTEPPIVSLDRSEQKKFMLLQSVFEEEFETRDNIQEEMLRMLLKRLIIKITRLAKSQLIPSTVEEHQLDAIRKFNVLVEEHYRTKHQVSEYAELLFKSPKTLSNYFSKLKKQTPLQIIQERLVLEGKRRLLYSNSSIKEIAFELGFNDAASFSKLFKKNTGKSPAKFKELQL